MVAGHGWQKKWVEFKSAVPRTQEIMTDDPCNGPIHPGYFSIKAAAKWAGDVSTRTILRWTKAGLLPTVQVVPRGRRLVRVRDLEDFLSGRRQVLKNDLNGLVEATMHDLGLRKL